MSKRSRVSLTGELRPRFEPTFYEFAEKRRQKVRKLSQLKRKSPRVLAVPESELPAGYKGTHTLELQLRLRGIVISRAGLTRLKQRGEIAAHPAYKVCTGRGRPADAWHLEETMNTILRVAGKDYRDET